MGGNEVSARDCVLVVGMADWSTPGAWDCDGSTAGPPPSVGDRATINGGIVTVSSPVSVSELNVNFGTSLSLQENLQILDGGVWGISVIGGDASLIVASGATWTTNAIAGNRTVNGYLRNDGTITWDSEQWALQGTGLFQNDGEFVLSNSQPTTFNLSVINNGTMSFSSVEGPTQIFPSLQNHGTLIAEANQVHFFGGLQNTGTLRQEGTGQFLFTTGSASTFGPASVFETPGSLPVLFNNGLFTVAGDQAWSFRKSMAGNFTLSGRLTLSGESLVPGAIAFLGPTGELELDAFANLDVTNTAPFTLNVPFINSGTVQWARDGWGFVGSGSILNNGWIVMDSTLGSRIDVPIQNNGVVRISNTSLVASEISGGLQNDGLIELLEGVLEFSNQTVTEGTLGQADGATLRFNGGTHEFGEFAAWNVEGSNPVVFQNGQFTVLGDRTWDFNLTMRGFWILGGKLTLDGNAGIPLGLEIQGVDGELAIGPDGIMTVVDSGDIYLEVPLVVDGEFRWERNGGVLRGSGLVTNNGSFRLLADEGTSLEVAIVNHGLLQSASANQPNSIHRAVQNTGTLSATAGVLRMNANTDLDGEIKTAGTGTIDFRNAAIHRFRETVSFEVNGSSPLRLSNGTYLVDGNQEWDFPLMIAGTLTPGGVLTLAGPLTAEDQLWVNGPGELVFGSTAIAQFSGTGNVNMSVPVTNEGTFNWQRDGFNLAGLEPFVNEGTFNFTTSGVSNLSKHLVNNGTAVFSGADEPILLGMGVDNNGLLRVTSGTARFISNSDSSGDFATTGSGILRFTNGVHVFRPQVTFDIAGSEPLYLIGTTVQVEGTPQWDFDVVLGNNVEILGEVTLTGNLRTQNFLSLSGAGALVLAPTCHAVIDGTGGVALNNTLRNEGRLDWRTESALSGFGWLVNEGVVDFLAGEFATITPAIENAGTWHMRRNTTDSTLMNGGLANSGSFLLESGSVRVSGTGSNSGLIRVDSGTTWVYGFGNQTFTSSSRLEVEGTLILEGTSMDVRGSVVSTAGHLNNVSGTITATNAAQMALHNVSFSSSGDFLAPSLMTVTGTFRLDLPSFRPGTGTVRFQGVGVQSMILNAQTNFHNLAVASGTTLLEVSNGARVSVGNNLLNSGAIRFDRNVEGSLPTGYGLTGAVIGATSQGGAAAISVVRRDQNHPEAEGDLQTRRWWQITTTGAPLVADLELPFLVAGNVTSASVCRKNNPGAGWDCGGQLFFGNRVLRTGISNLNGDWAVSVELQPDQKVDAFVLY